MEEIRWSRGPHDLRLGGKRVLPLPRSVVLAEGAEMRRFLTATGNTLTGRELAVFGNENLSWFVVVSPAGERAGDELAWTEDSREADGREVVVHSVLRAKTLFELVSEKSSAAQARKSLELILAGVREEETTRSPWWPLLATPLLLLLLIRRRRAR